MSESLYPYQLTGIAWLASMKAAVLADDMGLGKTAQAIVASTKVGARRILVLCPAIARDMWAREFAVWRPGVSVQIIRAASDAADLHGDVLVVSYALLDKIRPALQRVTFGLLIADEAQNLKSIDAVRTKAVYGKDGLIHCDRRVWLLSVSLAPNHVGEYWIHYRVLFHGRLSYADLINRYCLTKESSFGQQITGTNPDNLPELAKTLHPYILHRRQQDVLPDLPALRWGHIPVSPENVPPMPAITFEVAAILGKIERDEALSVTERMALATLRRWTGVAKMPAVIELIQAELESGIGAVVVFAVHREVIDTIVAALGPIAAAIHGDTLQHTRQVLIDSFQDGRMPHVLVIQISVGGTALTLHRSNCVIFAETSWTPADVIQASKRCHRIGQRHSVLATVISLSGSIDEQVQSIMTRKAREMAELDSMLRKENVA